MKIHWFAILTLLICAACNIGSNAPDVSNISVNLQTQRFDQDFFSLDSNALEPGMVKLGQKYPTLLPIFLRNILGTGDSSEIIRFLSANASIYREAQQVFPDFAEEEARIKKAYQYVNYYFPHYRVPAQIKTIVGPIDAMASMRSGEQTPDFLGPDFAGISLQFYLGSSYELYQQEFFISNIAPLYRSRRFEKKYIPVDLMKLVADDIYPDSSRGKSLIEQMIEKGKQWYLLQQFLPNQPDSLITGYTGKQLAWCADNEGLIWNRLMSEKLYSIDPETIQLYIGEGPSTQNMPQQSPGNIGQWVGWQIVQAYAEQTEKPLREVIATPFQEILEKAGYKPK